MRPSPYQTLFRFLAVMGYLIALLLLYSTQVSIERLLLNIETRLDRIENAPKAGRFWQERTLSSMQEADSSEKARTDISRGDPAYPNLLTEDLFYAKTLPSLLPPGFIPHGTFRLATFAKPDNLHPFSNWAHVIEWNNQCNVAVAKSHFGIYETFAPDMAVKIESRLSKDGSLTEYWIYLRDGVFWQPLKPQMFPAQMELSPFFMRPHQVTAFDFKFYFDSIINPWVEMARAVAAREEFADIDSFEVIDPLTFIVRWKNRLLEKSEEKDGKEIKYGPPRYRALTLTAALQPLPCFVYQYFANGEKILEEEKPDSYQTDSIWAQNFNMHWAKNVIVSCGPWIFESMNEEKILFSRNPNHYEPLGALMDRMEVKFMTSDEASWESFKAGLLDYYALPPDRMMEWEKFKDSPLYAQQKKEGNAIHRLDFAADMFSYIGWNMKRSLFKEEKVRQALTLAIDRKRLIEQIMLGRAQEINGPFLSTSPAYDSALAPWPFDPRKARLLLEEAGWKPRGDDGILSRIEDGKEQRFSFALTYYVKNSVSQAIAQFVALSLREIGVECRLKGVDIVDISAIFDDRNFDALFLSWGLAAPPEDPKQLWSSKNMSDKGSSNMVGFSNKEADRIIDELQWEYRPEERVKLFHSLGRILFEECPYTFLFTPQTTLLYRERLQNVWVPAKRQDLIPGANVLQPQWTIYWLKNN